MTTILRWAVLRNGAPVARRDVPVLEGMSFRASILDAVEYGARVAAFFGHQP